ncbi:hypothetical protein N7510_000397 [Penicillium lagena]|uniref:uncharacterized protein n=1 Tax=Penicillium lagena TaxID=94218 RepID=UPI0025424001|nr:uncharacterized protein N7510_000397 [Penicillium lagena]KAJ5624088.1 hypothetical protein N7510_000397 [Penicillium lagena]
MLARGIKYVISTKSIEDKRRKFCTPVALTFIDAVAHELFRWRPISPGSIPRRANNSQDFVPERWLRQDGDGEQKLRTDLPLPVFGQVRRICQGKRVATDGAFMQVANLLWAFDIEPADGEEIDPWAMVVADS